MSNLSPDYAELCPIAVQQIVSDGRQCLCDLSDVARPLEPMEEQLVALLRRGWVSPQDALRQIGLFSLAQRVSEMRRERGLPIVDEWRQVGRSRFKCYRLEG